MPCVLVPSAGLLTCAEHHDAVIVIDACAIGNHGETTRFATGPSHGLGVFQRLVGSLFAVVPTTGQLMPRPMEWRIVWENRRPSLAFDSPLCDLLACCIFCTITILCWAAFCARSSRRRSGLARAFTLLLLLQGGAWFLPAAEAARLDNALAVEAVAEAAHALDGDDALGSSSALAVAGRRLQTTTTCPPRGAPRQSKMPASRPFWYAEHIPLAIRTLARRANSMHTPRFASSVVSGLRLLEMWY